MVVADEQSLVVHALYNGTKMRLNSKDRLEGNISGSVYLSVFMHDSAQDLERSVQLGISYQMLLSLQLLLPN